MAVSKELFIGKNLACIRGNRILFRNLNFDLGQGEILHLSGANGTGKTSLLRMMAGALPVAEGEISWAGSGMRAETFAFLPADDRYLKPLETAGETLIFWAKLWGVSANSDAALESMNIAKLKDMPIRTLSAGQKRRVSLARIFLRPVPLWLLDEPLNGLDADSCRLFTTALHKHCAQGGIAVVASHLPVTGQVKTLEICK